MCFFFFTHKAAYEVRISDWSSDVCSSDLCPAYRVTVNPDGQVTFTGQAHVQTTQATGQATPDQLAVIHDALARADFDAMRASYVSRDDGCDMIMTDQPGIREIGRAHV